MEIITATIGAYRKRKKAGGKSENESVKPTKKTKRQDRSPHNKRQNITETVWHGIVVV